MTPNDLIQVEHIQRLAYAPELVEPIEVLASRLALAPEFSLAARLDEVEVSESCAGYLFAHPWPADESPGLGAELRVLPPNCQALHLHDMAIDPAHAGRGVGRALFDALIARGHAAGFRQLTLVAVQGAGTYWARYGLTVVRSAPAYGADAFFMAMNLASS